jgi:hypothetical protein
MAMMQQAEAEETVQVQAAEEAEDGHFFSNTTPVHALQVRGVAVHDGHAPMGHC